ncbi:MAG: thioether cross-link-forming SCIFF peptide maturase [Clostridiales bacterium]|nr:thioether cross-link-forming SCIFF peptide maturase [Clostridiales bacterium]
MVHCFSFDNDYYLYDVTSGSLHKCDALTCQVINKMQGLPYDFGGVEESVIREIEGEINELKAEGLLMKEDVNVAPPKSEHIKALCLHICHDCNLRCKYCFAGTGDYKGHREFMSEEVALKAVDFLIENSGNRKILEMDFFGGEPLLNFDVVKKTVEYANEKASALGKKFLFTMTTNGVLLRGEIADWLNENMENVVLSLDGRQEIHDDVRKTVNGKGSFEVIIQNFKDFVAKRGDKSYYIRGTFTNKNLDFAKDVLFMADSGFKEISLEPVVLEKGHELAITEEMLPEIKEEYKRLAREYIKRRKEGKGFHFFHFTIDLEGGPCLAKRVNACGAGNEYFSVTPVGDIYPCHQFADKPEFYMGNVFEGKINEEIRAKFKNSSLFTREGCEDCFARYHCSGGCAANNYVFNGDINKPYKQTCEMLKARTECAMHILSVEKEDQE